MQETHLELAGVRCPRCGGELVLRVLADQRGSEVVLTIDSACVACGVSPWNAPDQRTVIFSPGAPDGASAPGQDAESRLATAQGRIDGLLRRCEGLESSLVAAQRSLARAQASETDQALREEISRLEGELAAARAEIRRTEEATRGEVAPGKRPIEVE